MARPLQNIPFTIIGRNRSADPWNGLPVTLQVNESVSMPQTPNGTAVLTWMNQATQNNMGELALTSGGSDPDFLQAPPLSNRPEVQLQNWRANNLNLTNISAQNQTPILVQLFGPGISGQFPLNLPIASPLPLVTAQSAVAKTEPRYMQLVMTANTSSLTLFCIIGGPNNSSGSNGYVISLNDQSNTGPGTGKDAPAGYYATTTANSYPFSFNWQGADLYVVNMSAITAAAAQVLLRAL